VFIDYLLEDTVDFGDDFAAQVRREVVPDFRGRRGHASFSFTRARSSRTAWAVSLERMVELDKSDKLVQA
jgi:hypothetical protein